MKTITLTLSFAIGLFLMSSTSFAQVTTPDSVNQSKNNKTQVSQKEKTTKEKASVKENKGLNTKQAKTTQTQTAGKNAAKNQNKGQAKAAPQEKSAQGGNAKDNERNALIQSMVNQQNREKFKASLTPDQLSIVDNQNTSREEKKKALTESLSAEQRAMLKDLNKDQIQKNDTIKNTSASKGQMKKQEKPKK
jgi:hypothetical protein